MRLHLLETPTDHLAASGQFGLAIEVARSLLRADPLRESAHLALVRIHLAEGNLNEGRRAYTACEQVLHREFGIAPTAAMTGLINRLSEPRGNTRQSSWKNHQDPGRSSEAVRSPSGVTRDVTRNSSDQSNRSAPQVKPQPLAPRRDHIRQALAKVATGARPDAGRVGGLGTTNVDRITMGDALS